MTPAGSGDLLLVVAAIGVIALLVWSVIELDLF